MKLTPPRTLTVRLPGSLMEAIEHEAEASGATISDWVRSALQAVIERDPGASRHAATIYENAKTWAVLVRLMELQFGEDEAGRTLAEAEEAAKEYVEERLGKET